MLVPDHLAPIPALDVAERGLELIAFSTVDMPSIAHQARAAAATAQVSSFGPCVVLTAASGSKFFFGCERAPQPGKACA